MDAIVEKPHRRRTITSSKIKADSPAARIVDKFGGLSAFCRACDFAIPTVHRWMVEGLVPSKRKNGMSYAAWIITCAEARGIDVGPADFIDLPIHG